MFRAQSNIFDDVVVKATDENLTSENWEYILVYILNYAHGGYVDGWRLAGLPRVRSTSPSPPAAAPDLGRTPTDSNTAGCMRQGRIF
jgi:hypothetical protein